MIGKVISRTELQTSLGAGLANIFSRTNILQELRTRRWVFPVLAYVMIQCLFIFFGGTSAFYDEAAEVVAGVRTVQGYGIADRYLTWFDGSLLWSVVAVPGQMAGGIVGARLVAVTLSTTAMIFTVRAASLLFGEDAAFWTGVNMVASAPFFALGHLAVYDQPALAGVALSFWATIRFIKSGKRLLLLIAAFALAFSAVSKYPIFIMAAPIALMIAITRKERIVQNLAILTMVVCGVALSYFLLFRDQLTLLPELGDTESTWHPAQDTILFLISFYVFAPLSLSALGWRISGQLRPIAAALMTAALLWPTIHLITENPLSVHKHIVYGFLFAYPLCGLVLARMYSNRVLRPALIIVVVGLSWLGIFQQSTLEYDWPDVRPGVDYLATRVQRGQKLLINDSWPYTMDLFTQGKLDSPLDVYDTYTSRDKYRPSVPICQFDWFVDEEGYFYWTNQERNAIPNCGTFRPVYEFTRSVIGLGSDLKFFTYPIKTTVWRNTRQLSELE